MRGGKEWRVHVMIVIISSNNSSLDLNKMCFWTARTVSLMDILQQVACELCPITEENSVSVLNEETTES